jgi:hypothetical protein
MRAANFLIQERLSLKFEVREAFTRDLTRKTDRGKSREKFDTMQFRIQIIAPQQSQTRRLRRLRQRLNAVESENQLRFPALNLFSNQNERIHAQSEKSEKESQEIACKVQEGEAIGGLILTD